MVTTHPPHSWRTQLLPYIEEKQLFDRIAFDVAWNVPPNTQLHVNVPHILQSHRLAGRSSQTHYFAVIGANSIWQNREITTDDLKDDPSTTLLFVELDMGINWMSPHNVTIDELLNVLKTHGQLPSPHPGFVNMAFADYSVRSVPHKVITPMLLRALVTIGGGEEIQDDFVISAD